MGLFWAKTDFQAFGVCLPVCPPDHIFPGNSGSGVKQKKLSHRKLLKWTTLKVAWTFFLTPDPLFPGNMWSGVQDLVPQSVDGFRHSWQGPFFLRKTHHSVDGFWHSWQGPFFFSKNTPFGRRFQRFLAGAVLGGKITRPFSKNTCFQYFGVPV